MESTDQSAIMFLLTIAEKARNSVNLLYSCKQAGLLSLSSCLDHCLRITTQSCNADVVAEGLDGQPLFMSLPLKR